MCHIFADDTKVYNTSDNREKLQKDLDNLKHWSETWQLYFNRSKCKCLYYGRNNPEEKYFFYSSNGPEPIGKGTEEKDLGVTFDPSLKFNKHINTVVNKANGTLGLIRRNFKFIDKDIFLKLYKALVRPHLEYGQTIWYPYLKKQSTALENVQRRATKLVTSIANLPYSKRLKILKLPSLKYRRIRGDLITVYNICKDSNFDKEESKLLKFSGTESTRGHDLKLFKESCKTDTRKFSFSQRVVSLWNALNTNTIHANNVNIFKKLLDENLVKYYYLYDE